MTHKWKVTFHHITPRSTLHRPLDTHKHTERMPHHSLTPLKWLNNLLSLIWSFSLSLSLTIDFQSCLICVARRVPMKERPMLPTHESFTTRQDLQGNHANASPLSPLTLFKGCSHHSQRSSQCTTPRLKQQIPTLTWRDCLITSIWLGAQFYILNHWKVLKVDLDFFNYIIFYINYIIFELFIWEWVI